MSEPIPPFEPAAASANAVADDFEGFAFLPPLAPNPHLRGQKPRAGLAPDVEICVLDTSVEPWECVSTLVTFGPSEIEYTGSHYKVVWHTRGVAAGAGPFRIMVGVGSELLGSLDVQLVDGGPTGPLKGGEGVRLAAGRAVPIQFFLGEDLEDDLCGTGYDCRVATAYDGQDNLFVTRDGDASLFIPDAALPPGGPYAVLIRELDQSVCDQVAFPADLPVGASLPNFPSCYEYLLDPDPVMQDFISIGQCIDLNAVAAYDANVQARVDELQLGAFHGPDANLAPGVPLYELAANGPSPAALSCDDYEPGPNSTGASALIRDVKRGVKELLFGTPAYAGHSGLGGTVLDKSIVQWYDPGVRVAGFSTDRGGLSSPESAALAPAMAALVQTYGYVWRTSADRLDAASAASAADPDDPYPLFNADVDLTLLGTVKENTAAIAALDAAEQAALSGFVDAGGCALLMPDNNQFGGGSDAVNESLIDPFGLDITGTLTGQQTATVTPAGAGHPATAGIAAYLQNYPGWFDGLGGGTVLATNAGGAALVAVPGGQGTYGSSGPVFAYSDANQFFPPSFSGRFDEDANEQLFLQSVAACGTEPAPPAP